MLPRSSHHRPGSRHVVDEWVDGWIGWFDGWMVLVVAVVVVLVVVVVAVVEVVGECAVVQACMCGRLFIFPSSLG